jgi:hypothetical protein
MPDFPFPERVLDRRDAGLAWQGVRQECGAKHSC